MRKMGLSESVADFLQSLLRIFAVIVRFGGTLSVALMVLALGWISNEITTRAFGSTVFEFFGSWMWVFALLLLVLSLLIIYAVKRIGGLEE